MTTEATSRAAAAMGRARSTAKATAARANGQRGGRPVDLTIDPAGAWRLYWPGPLPVGAEACGTVTRMATGETGALLRLPTGLYVQGNARALRGLPQSSVKGVLGK